MIFPGAMLAHEADPKRLVFPCAAESKLDGFRTVFLNGAGYTRNGRTYETTRPFAELLRTYVGDDVLVDCELMAADWNSTSKLLKRLKGVDHTRIAAEVTCHVFDVVGEDQIGQTPYSERRPVVEALVQAAAARHGLRIVATNQKIVRSEEESSEAFADALAQGHEGLVFKTLDGVWVPKRSWDWQKRKPWRDITLTVTGYECRKGGCPDCALLSATRATEGCPACGGTGRVTYPDELGALVCTDESGAEVRVGGGWTDAQRTALWSARKTLAGRKCDVKVQDCVGGQIVARHPVWLRWREDL